MKLLVSIISALLAVASPATQAAYKNGWYSLENERGHCGFIFYGPLSRDQIKTPNKGECAFQIAGEYVKMDERGLRDISLPRVSTSKAYYIDSVIKRYAIEYEVYRAYHYLTPSEYLKDIVAWNPKECRANYNNGIALNRIASVTCITNISEFEFESISMNTQKPTLLIKLVLTDTD